MVRSATFYILDANLSLANPTHRYNFVAYYNLIWINQYFIANTKYFEISVKYEEK